MYANPANPGTGSVRSNEYERPVIYPRAPIRNSIQSKNSQIIEESSRNGFNRGLNDSATNIGRGAEMNIRDSIRSNKKSPNVSGEKIIEDDKTKNRDIGIGRGAGMNIRDSKRGTKEPTNIGGGTKIEYDKGIGQGITTKPGDSKSPKESKTIGQGTQVESRKPAQNVNDSDSPIGRGTGMNIGNSKRSTKESKTIGQGQGIATKPKDPQRNPKESINVGQGAPIRLGTPAPTVIGQDTFIGQGAALGSLNHRF
ncbi:unnamed protein product [Bursaphelenchus okinawaensis]|uniref:Uncharacterized protein n=1 Tax=Bursaphelenchus okinawaensis TaxID=465554 RepID=A0A811JQR3_9BILA|nr:unnamed protein product [Bursaphelenchus okinawaensis]CAG9077988.1 unnamed protein product [Bursaphelenchus okinawaensis]